MAEKKQVCMIIGASPISGKKLFQEYPPARHFVICADAGYETAQALGIVPDLIVGDFDSAAKKPSKGGKVMALPVEKDVTDTMFAAMKGLAAGFREFVLLGCLGGSRFDHSLANLEVLRFLRDRGARGVLADEHTKIFLLREERLRMTGVSGATVSVFPYGNEACTVSYTGLQYPLDHDTLTSGGLVMGVSNCVVEDRAEIRVHAGIALAVIYQP